MDVSQLAIVGASIILFAFVSRRMAQAPVTMPMMFVAAGWLAAAVGAVELDLEVDAIVVLGEFTLAVILFSDAVRINITALRRDAALPGRLLAIGLPLSIGIGAIMIALVIPAFSFWEAALLAAILAPTDAALGQAVVEDLSVPLRVRQALNVESGLNDGLVLPAVLLFLALATGEDTSAEFWIRFATRQVGLGILVGLAIGAASGWVMNKARDGGWVDGIYAQLGTLSVAVTAFLTALAVESNGFLAAFVAGLAFGAVMPDQTAEHVSEYAEDSGRLLAIIAFFVFGNVLLHDHLGNPSITVLVSALLILTVGRILPVAVALIGLRPAKETIAFIGWFGPRGLASILFGLILLEEELPGSDELFGIIAWTVLGSVVLHGATASWGARTYGAWFADMSEEEAATMPESVPVEPTRTRWSR